MIVLWRITERCNLACGFCAYDRRLPGARRDVDAAAVRRFGRVLGDWRRATGERVLLGWLGGEPTLWPPLLATSAWLRGEHGIDVSATTNGTTLHRDAVVDGIVAGLAELTVSVDGLREFHDAVRGWRGGFDRLRAGVQALAAARARAGAGLKLRANVVLMRDNLAQFAALCDALADWGIDEITFNQLGGRDRPEFFPAHRLSAADVASLRAQLPALRASLAARGVRLCGGDAYLRRLEASATGLALPVAECAPGEAFAFIDEAGRIAPCSFTAGEYGVSVHDLADAADLAALPSRYRAARAATPAAACGDCPSNHVFAKFSA